MKNIQKALCLMLLILNIKKYLLVRKITEVYKTLLLLLVMK